MDLRKVQKQGRDETAQQDYPTDMFEKYLSFQKQFNFEQTEYHKTDLTKALLI